MPVLECQAMQPLQACLTSPTVPFFAILWMHHTVVHSLDVGALEKHWCSIMRPGGWVCANNALNLVT